MIDTMTEHETLLSLITVKPKDEPIYSENATVIALEDEGAGLFVTVSQEGGWLMQFDCDWHGFSAWCGKRIVYNITNDVDKRTEWLWDIDPDFCLCFGDWLDCREMAAMTGCLDSPLC